jgi:2-C-methyl-D-erythritol 4-phosphate cytidylyltransferase
MNFAIIVAAGEGKRAGVGRPKQFREISGAPIIIHTLKRFEQCTSIHKVVLVAPQTASVEALTLVREHHLSKVISVLPGGGTRLESVWAGLKGIPPSSDGVIAIHDGVRPFVSVNEIDMVVAKALATGAAILATRVTDTVKVSDGKLIEQTLDRAKLWRAQTPQCFRHELIRKAYARAVAEGIEATDDSVLVEQLGVSVSLVEGSAQNIKITTSADIVLAETLLSVSR